MSTVQDVVERKLQEAFRPTLLEVINESHMHSVPKNSETHFKCLIVSDHFTDMSRLKRQQQVYQVLDKELKSGIHALSLRCLSPLEALSDSFVSPKCASKT